MLNARKEAQKLLCSYQAGRLLGSGQPASVARLRAAACRHVEAAVRLQVYQPLEFLFTVAAFTTLIENFLPQLIALPKVWHHLVVAA